jgi:hypothetical protein
MRSVFKISLLAIAAIALVAGNAFAEAAVSGDISSSFGQYSNDNASAGAAAKKSGGYVGALESSFYISGGTGALTGKIRFRVREAGAINTVRGNLYWKTSDMLTVNFHGRSLGMNGFTANATVGNVRLAGLDHDITDVSGGPWNREMIGVDMNVGPMVSLALASNCQFCSAPAGSTNEGQQAFLLGAAGKAGAISYNVGFQSGSGKLMPSGGTPALVDETATKGTSMVLGVGFAGEGFSVGFDYATNGSGEVTDTAGAVIAPEIKNSGMQLGVSAANVGFSYFTMSNTVGTGDPQKEDEIAVSYKMPVSDAGHTSVEFRQRTGKPSVGTGDKEMLIAFGAKTKF